MRQKGPAEISADSFFLRNRDQDCDSDRPSSVFCSKRTILWLFIPVGPFRGWFYNKQPGTACFSLNTVSLQDYFNVTSMSLQSQLQYHFKVNFNTTSKSLQRTSKGIPLLTVQLPFISCFTLWYDCVDANGPDVRWLWMQTDAAVQIPLKRHL